MGLKSCIFYLRRPLISLEKSLAVRGNEGIIHTRIKMNRIDNGYNMLLVVHYISSCLKPAESAM